MRRTAPPAPARPLVLLALPAALLLATPLPSLAAPEPAAVLAAEGWKGGEAEAVKAFAALAGKEAFTLRVRGVLPATEAAVPPASPQAVPLFVASSAPKKTLLSLTLHPLGPGVLVGEVGTSAGRFVIGAPLAAADREGARDIVLRAGADGLALYVDGVRRAHRPVAKPLALPAGATVLFGAAAGEGKPALPLPAGLETSLWPVALSDRDLAALSGGRAAVARRASLVRKQLAAARVASPAAHAEALARAESAVAAARPRVADDRRRPLYHFQAPALWMNDPNGPIYADGAYHMFYQFNPYGTSWGHMHWGHARSRDLVNWEHLPIALAPSHDLGEQHCFSGCAVIDRGVAKIFYTSIGPATTVFDGATQWMAESRDGLRTWKKFPRNPVVTHDDTPGGIVIRDARDPFIYREERGKDAGWYMVVSGHREGGKGGAYLYRATRLEGPWKFVSIVMEGTEENWECPNLFRLGEGHALVYSPHSVVKYYTGALDAAQTLKPRHHGILDHTRTFYAPNSLVDPRGRRIMWGWLRVAGEGWNGMLSAPRVLTMLPDGRIGQTPAPELESLRTEPRTLSAGPLPAQGEAPAGMPEVSGEALDLDVTLAPGRANEVGLWGARAGEPPGALVRYDRAAGTLHVGKATVPLRLGAEEPLHLRLLVDRSVMELFVNGREAVTVEIPGVAPQLSGLRPYARGAGAEVVRFAAWRMRPAPIADAPRSAALTPRP